WDYTLEGAGIRFWGPVILATGAALLGAAAYRRLRVWQLRRTVTALTDHAPIALDGLRDESVETRRIVTSLVGRAGGPSELAPAPAPAGDGREMASTVDDAAPPTSTARDPAGAALADLGALRARIRAHLRTDPWLGLGMIYGPVVVICWVVTRRWETL